MHLPLKKEKKKKHKLDQRENLKAKINPILKNLELESPSLLETYLGLVLKKKFAIISPSVRSLIYVS